jgi:23S rRNA pseudouridine1911/1915/1917 synthase
VFSADADVAAEYAPGRDGHRLLRSAFGERFVPGPDAPVDKAALGKAMREDAGVRRQVEALLHPLVRHNLEVFWREQEAAGAALAAAEIPLYLEAGALFQTAPGEPRPVLVGVSCPFAIREERLLETRHWPPEVIAAMESWQWPEEAKMRACDYVVDNSDDLAAFTREGEALLAALHALKDKRDAESLERIAATIDAAPPSPGTPEW